MDEQLDLFGNVVKKKHKDAPSMSVHSYCYRCGKRIAEGEEIPVALHTDYCRTCYDAAMERQAASQ